jgi:hypothetical protein
VIVGEEQAAEALSWPNGGKGVEFVFSGVSPAPWAEPRCAVERIEPIPSSSGGSEGVGVGVGVGVGKSQGKSQGKGRANGAAFLRGAQHAKVHMAAQCFSTYIYKCLDMSGGKTSISPPSSIENVGVSSMVPGEWYLDKRARKVGSIIYSYDMHHIPYRHARCILIVYCMSILYYTTLIDTTMHLSLIHHRCTTPLSLTS